MGKGTIGRRLPARHDGGARSGHASRRSAVESKPRRSAAKVGAAAIGPMAKAAVQRKAMAAMRKYEEPDDAAAARP
ncbi:hypothetical protein Scep_003936 [Stephania cephalantha]|uniref:Uncharacterized protein n=1 Tax=Stephania cephalantha TaxID=152367 RepID=A0AAP0KRG6_9MAGN